MSAIVCVAMIFAFILGICAGIQYQKQQPVKVYVISFIDGDVVNNQTFLHPVEMGQTTFISDDHYYWNRNVSFYALLVIP